MTAFEPGMSTMPGYVPEGLRRYTEDNEFRLLVDTLHSFIRENQYTPGELRLAVHEACVQYENTRITPRFIPTSLVESPAEPQADGDTGEHKDPSTSKIWCNSVPTYKPKL